MDNIRQGKHNVWEENIRKEREEIIICSKLTLYAVL